MSFSSEYAALRKKRKKNEEEETSETSSKNTNTSPKTSSFAEQYAKLRSERTSSAADKKDDDIAPVRDKGMYAFGDRFLNKYAPTTADRATNSQTVAFRKFDEQNAIMRSRFKTRLDEIEANKPENIRKAIEAEAKENEEQAKKLGMSVSDYLKLKGTVDASAQKNAFEQQRTEWEQKSDSQREFEVMTGRRALQLAQQQEALKAEEEAKKEEKKRTWFQANAFEDGYDFGDVTKSVGATLGDIGVNAFQGFASMGEGIIDFALYAAASNGGSRRPIRYNAQTGEAFDNAEALREAAQKDVVGDFLAPAKEWLDKGSFLGDKSDSVSQGLGQIGGIYLTGGLGGAIGGTAGATALTTGSMFLSSAGQGVGEAYQSGASEGEAWGYGMLKGIADAGSELLFGGLGKGVNALGVSRGLSSLDDMFAKKLSDAFSKQVVKNFVEFGVKSSFEGVEEVLAGLGTAVAQKLTYMSDEELSQLIKDQDLREQFVVGTVTSFLAQSGYIPGTKNGSLRESNKMGRDFITGYTQSEQSVIDRELADRIAELEKDGEELSEKDKKKLLEEVQSDVERGFIDTDKIEEILGGDRYTAWKDADAKESELIEEYEKLADTPSMELSRNQQKRLDELEAQIESLRSKPESTRLRGELSSSLSEQLKNSRLNESYNERVRRREKFVDDVSKYENEAAKKSIQNLIDIGYANNSNAVHDFADNVAKMAEASGQVFSFVTDEKLREMGKAKEGRRVNGFIDENGITVNLDSRAWEFVVGHEVTHAFDKAKSYGNLHEAIKAYAEQKGEWNTRLAEMKELYEGQNADAEAELVSDLVGEYLFGDADFINSLSTKHQNVFQKMYAEIKHLLKMVTAGSKQARQLERAKHAFEKAMREGSTASVEGTKHSLSADSDGKELTEGQKEYFKDSKMRDENGALKVMYHGSQDAGFHTFDGRYSDDDISFFFVDRNDVAASYSGTTETYEARTIRTAEDMNKFLAEIGYDQYEAVERDGKFELLEDGDHVAYSDTAQGIYDEFCWYEGVGEGDANYKVYLNLKNPLEVDAKGRPWNKIDAEFSQEVYDRYNSLTAEEKAALIDLAEWEDFSLFNSEIQYAEGNELASAYAKMGEDVNIYDLFSVAADSFSEEAMRENARQYLNTREFAKRAKDGGYDGVIFKNIIDNGGYSNGDEGASTVAVAFDSAQIKSVANEMPTGDADIRYSLSSMGYTFFGNENTDKMRFKNRDYKETEGYKAYVDQCVDNYRQTRGDIFDEETTRKEIEDAIDGIVKVAVAAKEAGYDITDYAERRSKRDSKGRLLFSSLEPNSDYFTSNDISSICDKRKNFAEIYDDIVKAEEKKGVPENKRFFRNVDNYFYLHQLMAEKGLTQPCRQCYVESMRKNLAPMADAFLRLVGETDPNNKANDQLFQTRGKNKGQPKVNNTALRERVLEALASYSMSPSDLNIEKLTTADGLAELKITAPNVYEAFNSFYGQSKPKMPRGATPFRFGELTALLTDEKGKIKQNLVDRINKTGGFRLQSYSDFQIENFVDTLQVIFEAGSLGLKGHAYTKVPAFLDATKGTNLKRNISIFMYSDGGEWKIDRNDSFPYTLDEIYDIVKADKTGNTSIIAVSQNADMSAWIMANDLVGYGIPFHKSGIKMGVVRDTTVKEGGREIKGYSDIKDHTRQQSEVYADSKTKVSEPIDIYEFWDFENTEGLPKNKLIEKNLKAYIDRCFEAGYLPKFREYIIDNGKVLRDVLRHSKNLGYSSPDATIDDISFEHKGLRIPYGYYKFLGDFGMFAPDGSAAPAQTLSLNDYNFDEAVEFFKDSEGLHAKELLQQFANGNERKMYREMYDKGEITIEGLEKIIKQKRGEIVDDVVSGKKSYAASLSRIGEDVVDRNAHMRLHPLEDVLPVREDANVQESAKDARSATDEDVMPMPEAEQRIDLKYLMAEDEALPVREDVQAEAETAVPTPETAEATPITTVGERLSAKKGNYETELESNKANRAQAWANYDAAIAEAQAEYDGLKNKNTKRANDILRRIDRYKRQQANVDADYAKRISDIESRIGRTSEKIELNEQRKAQLASDIASLNMPTQERESSGKIAKSLTEESGKNRKERKQRSILSLIKEYVLDNGMVFEDESKKHHNRQLEADWNMIRNAKGMAQRFLERSTNGAKSIVELEAEVRKKGLTQDLYDYLHHKHNVDRMSIEGKAQAKIADIIANNPVLGTLLERNQSTGDILNDPLFKQNADTLKADVDKILKLKEAKNHPVFGDTITAEISVAEAAKLEKAHPELKSYAEEIYANNRHLRDMLVEEGIITPETAQLWEEMYPHFVPIRRAKKSNGSGEYGRRQGVNAPLKRAEGGNTDIEPIFNTIALRAEQTYKAVLKNRFGVELMNTIQTPIVEADNKLGGKIDTPDGVENTDSLLMPGDGENAPTFTVFENGERVTFEITEEMYDAMRPAGDALSYTSKGLQAASNLMRSLLTEYNLPFMVGNAKKDAQDILMNSQHPAETYAAIPKAIAQIASKGNYLTEYMDYGGQSLSFFDNQKMEFVKKNVPKEVFMTLTGLNAISKANKVVELMPRLAEYIASREAGRSIEISMLDAARVTTNFAAGGKLTKLLNRNGATFLNASVQGFMQNVRNIREAKMNGLKGWAGLAARTILAGAPALILNNLIWDDDDEYEELSDYIKQNYYIVCKFGDGKFVRIPKGRTVAVIQDAFMQISNAITGDDEVDFESFAQLVINNLVPNNPYEDNVASPIVKMMMNETWYGGDLVPTRLQDSPEAEQYDETTDAISKWLGEKLNFSPYKINYLLDQYTGGIGDILLPMITPESETGDDNFVDYVTAPFRDKFTTDSVLKNQNTSDFYDLKDELNVNANSSKATDDDTLKNKYMNAMSDRISELQKQKREIQSSNLSKSEKYELTRDLQKEIVALTKEAIDSYENLNEVDDTHTEIGGYYFEWYTPEEGEPYWRKMTDSQKTKYLLTKDATGHYVTNGSVHYRLDKDGSWTKISDKDLARQNEVTKELGITPDEYWSKTETSFFPVKNGEYEYAYENPGNYAVAKAVGGYDSYKSYSKELSGIKADKDENGKSISGSRKEKVLDYINGLDIDYGEKIILFKNEYNADDTYNDDIVDYLNSRDDISYSEMKTILEELGATLTHAATSRGRRYDG